MTVPSSNHIVRLNRHDRKRYPFISACRYGAGVIVGACLVEAKAHVWLLVTPRLP